MSIGLRFAVRSDVGLLRDGNEDAAYAGPRLLAVADGMGGHAAGEVASRLAITCIAALADSSALVDAGAGADGEGPADAAVDVLTALRGAVEQAQAAIRNRAAADPALEGMGTTLTALLWSGDSFGLAHVGDSRGYLFRDGTLERITHDHTYVQDLVDSGQITPDEAVTHPQRSLITRALDGRSIVEPDLSEREIRIGDRYLLCSDGLCGVVSDTTLARALLTEDVGAAADELIELALRGGGPDNITVVVCDVTDTADPPIDPVVVGAAADVAMPTRGSDSPAGRAALALQPRRRRRRPLVAGLAVGLVLALAAAGGWLWIRTQYFVGVSGDEVAIFRGVAWSVAGFSLHSMSEPVAVDPARLPEFERERLRAGIVAATLPQARQVADRLALEQCAAAAPLPTAAPPRAAATPSPTASAAGSVGTATPAVPTPSICGSAAE